MNVPLRIVNKINPEIIAATHQILIITNPKYSILISFHANNNIHCNDVILDHGTNPFNKTGLNAVNSVVFLIKLRSFAEISKSKYEQHMNPNIDDTINVGKIAVIVI